jgi:acetyl-CoA carboxylase / biotin carboxylase 1
MGASVQVWYPDSAAKTAQTIEEFEKEGLPLIILANWRGFSGGKRDLFDGVLQAGSCIVEALRQYRWPVIVYLPPGCELRGGAWVVVDSQISAGVIEMFAGALFCPADFRAMVKKSGTSIRICCAITSVS